MTDDEQQIAQAIARAFETLSEGLSNPPKVDLTEAVCDAPKRRFETSFKRLKCANSLARMGQIDPKKVRMPPPSGSCWAKSGNSHSDVLRAID